MQFDIVARGVTVARVPIDRCFSMISDHARTHEWGKTFDDDDIRMVVTHPGMEAPNGTGCERLLTRTGSDPATSVVNIYWPPHILGYRVTNGGPLKDHQGIFVLTPVADGTEIKYQVTCNRDERYGKTRLSDALMQTLVERIARWCESAS